MENDQTPPETPTAPIQDWYTHPSTTGTPPAKISTGWTVLGIVWGIFKSSIVLLIVFVPVVLGFISRSHVSTDAYPSPSSGSKVYIPPAATPTPDSSIVYAKYGLRFEHNLAADTVKDATASAGDTGVLLCVVVIPNGVPGDCSTTHLPLFLHNSSQNHYRVMVRALTPFPEGGDSITVAGNTGKLYASQLMSYKEMTNEYIRAQTAQFNSAKYTFIIEQFNDVGTEPANQQIVINEFKKFLEGFSFSPLP